MSKERITAIQVGLLFIITMILGMIDAYAVAPILNQPIDTISLNETRVLVGAFSILLMSIGVVFIAILLYPIIEKENKFIALTYVGFRIMECLLLLVGVIVYFLLISLSNEYINSGLPVNSYFHTISSLAIEARYSSYQVAMFILSIASLMVFYIFYKKRLIPRIISIVGLIGYACVLVSAPLDLLGIIDTTAEGGVLYVPGAIFEMILFPAWLIFKGFDLSKVENSQ